ncbi:hypothetical protein R3X27_18860 [Tropicimonas sp. TH_r6]|uniref:hypothetical protein n=1 Tax=Tropicimonas sp. TH_r6 TaxID=3082085 RepID=UPI0029532DA7|nr:hypothetical protein [Tropicimonas sp. TH_r6]MDV7144747.1 hypothetical protein [Tropicimonas sp. TH_r6]
MKNPRKSENAKKLLDIIQRQQAKNRSGASHPDTKPVPRKIVPSKMPCIEDTKRQLEHIASDGALLQRVDPLPSPDLGAEAVLSKRLLAGTRLINETSRDAGLLGRLRGNRDRPPLDLVVGFDLGSTSSKVVLRFPYEEGLGSYAIPAPKCIQADGVAYYWRSVLWQDDLGRYSLVPSVGAQAHDQIKVDFMSVSNSEARKAKNWFTRQALVAYQALMIRQALGWVSQKLGKALDRHEIRVGANFGFPAKSYTKSDVFDDYEKCCQASVYLALGSDPITNESVQGALALEPWEAYSNQPPVTVVPEFIGAVLGFFMSNRRRTGQFILADIGGLTVDCVCFGYSEPRDGDPKLLIYAADVQKYGAEIGRVYAHDKQTSRAFSNAIGSFVCGPIIESHKKVGHNAPAWDGRMPMFLIGGGRHFGPFGPAFSWAQDSLKNSKFRTTFDVVDLKLDEEVDLSEARGKGCGRLLVALGLSHSDLDLPEWITPDELPDAPPAPHRDPDGGYIGPEQV